MPTSPPRHNPLTNIRKHNYETRRPSACKRGYGRQHQKIRLLTLERDPLCVMCLKEGEVVPSTVSDHIIPMSAGGHPYALSNRQGLCEHHHNKKTATVDRHYYGGQKNA